MRLRCSSFLHTPRRAWKGMHMRNYTTQMEAARKQIVTKELEIVAQKEHMTTEELMPLVAEGKVVICANKITPVLIRKESVRCCVQRSM